MPKISSTDATIHATIHALHNPALFLPLATLRNIHKEALIYLEEIAAVPPRVTVREAYQEKIQQVNQEETQIKFYPNQSNYSRMQNLRG